MNSHVLIATLGSQPQIITLALDRLLETYPITKVNAIHLQSEIFPTVQKQLSKEFKDNQYNGKLCQIHYTLVLYNKTPIQVINSLDTLSAVSDRFKQLFYEYKNQGDIIHLCLSGGPRLLGYAALLMAQQTFDAVDHIWHLYSSSEIREKTKNGSQMHSELEHENIKLIDAPFSSIHLHVENHVFEKSPDYKNAKDVWDALSSRPQEVLYYILQNFSDAEIAKSLSIQVKTVQTHKTKIFQECQYAWKLQARSINTQWVADHFACIKDYIIGETQKNAKHSNKI